MALLLPPLPSSSGFVWFMFWSPLVFLHLWRRVCFFSNGGVKGGSLPVRVRMCEWTFGIGRGYRSGSWCFPGSYISAYRYFILPSKWTLWRVLEIGRITSTSVGWCYVCMSVFTHYFYPLPPARTPSSITTPARMGDDASREGWWLCESTALAPAMPRHDEARCTLKPAPFTVSVPFSPTRPSEHRSSPNISRESIWSSSDRSSNFPSPYQDRSSDDRCCYFVFDSRGIWLRCLTDFMTMTSTSTSELSSDAQNFLGTKSLHLRSLLSLSIFFPRPIIIITSKSKSNHNHHHST